MIGMGMTSAYQIKTPFPGSCQGTIPSPKACRQLWDNYKMLDNIRRHSLLVASIAIQISSLALERGWKIDLDCVRAAGLLHDIAKTYCIEYGGDHCQLGAAWVMRETENPALAQAVLHHVYWPGPLDLSPFFLPLVVLYADKRVQHDQLVSVRQRFSDILCRYGHSREKRCLIKGSRDQVLGIEQGLNHAIGVDLDAYTFDSRGLVE
jgi:putative nucleotidyltransferase with HDIG domain